MYPVITQAIAAERTREMQAHAAAAGRGRQLRRSRRARRTSPVPGTAGAGHDQAFRPAPRPLRDPRAA
jgi:hypothetical protein